MRKRKKIPPPMPVINGKCQGCGEPLYDGDKLCPECLAFRSYVETVRAKWNPVPLKVINNGKET